MVGLSPRQKEVLIYMYEYLCKNWRQPTFREIGKHFGKKKPLSTNAVNDYFMALERKGYIERNFDKFGRGKSRAVIFTDKAKDYLVDTVDETYTLFYEG